MSVAEFGEALKSTALKNWFQRLSTDNILKMSAKDIRKKESGKEFNSFYITPDTISKVIEKLTSANASPQAVEKVFKALKDVVYNNKYSSKQIKEPYIEGKGLYYPRVSFDTINTILEKGFEDVLLEARKSNPDLKISDYFQRGHVFGIFPKKVSGIKESLSKNETLTTTAKALLIGVLSDLEKQLMEEDLATSNLKTPKFKLYAKYAKNSSKYLVELQLKEENEEAGRQQATLAKALRKYFNPGAVTFTTKGIKFSDGEAEQRIKSLIESNVEKLVGTKGSPSMLELIGFSIKNILQGKKTTEPTYKIAPIEIASTKASLIDTKALNNKVKDDLKAIRKLKASAKNVPSISRVATSTQVNLTSLQNLINASLQNVISANMGDGSSRNILNYRTGRLAASASVERMSESRAGMITAFYTYMKNPYQTFEPGYAQGKPTSRDPKLLIAKSIREIAALRVGNRLRAVSI